MDNSEASQSQSLKACKHCGFVWLASDVDATNTVLLDGRIIKCSACPARNVSGGNKNCLGCGCSVQTEFAGAVFRCDSCLSAGATRGRCCYPRHHGNRVLPRSMVRAYIDYTRVKREEVTVYACETCAHRFRLKPWEDRELALFRESETLPVKPPYDATLTDSDPYKRVGGRGCLWKPKKGPAGVGSYLLFRWTSDAPVYVDGKRYVARCGECEGRRVFTFVVPPNGARHGDWIFFAVTDCNRNSNRHTYASLHGDRDAVMERALQLTTVGGALVVDTTREMKR